MLDHAWIKQVDDMKNLPDQKKSAEIAQNLKHFGKVDGFTSGMIALISNLKTNDEELQELDALFKKFDKNNDGSLTKDELYEGMNSVLGMVDVAKHYGEDFFNKLDTNGDGVVDRAEFIAGTINQSRILSKENIHAMYRMLDQDGDEALTIKELKEVFTTLPDSFDGEQKNKVEKMWEEIFRKADTDGNGTLDIDEFTSALLGTNTQ